MAALIYYTWLVTDTLWGVAGRMLNSSGYTSTISLAQAIRAANPSFLDWTAIPTGTQIILPLIVLY